MLDTVGQALKNRTPHLNGEKYLTNKDVCRMLHISTRNATGLAGHGQNTVYNDLNDDDLGLGNFGDLMKSLYQLISSGINVDEENQEILKNMFSDI